MTELQKEQLVFLEDTLNFYSEDVSRRSVKENSDDCYYFLKLGLYNITAKKCAIGRHIPEDKYNKKIEGKGLTAEIMESFLPEEIQILGFEFLSMMQNLHDERDFWDSNGLSDLGKRYVKRIKRNLNN